MYFHSQAHVSCMVLQRETANVCGIHRLGTMKKVFVPFLVALEEIKGLTELSGLVRYFSLDQRDRLINRPGLKI